jgi:hypothetical protein
MHCCTTVCSHVVLIASGSPFQPVADAQDLPLPAGGDAHHDIERGVANLPVADLDHDRVDEDHRIERVQRASGPLSEFAGDLLRDPADGVLDTFAP